MNILVLNCGSSSLKFQIIHTDRHLIETNGDVLLVKGVVERIGGMALISLKSGDPKSPKEEKWVTPLKDHLAAVDLCLKSVIGGKLNLPSLQGYGDIHAVGHRVVHGGEKFKASMPITPDVIQGITDNMDLAPLHNSANLMGIKATMQALGPSTPQVAVFDTAFHASLPEKAYLYPLPYSLYRRLKIRKYGFHGTSHRYVAYRYRTLLSIPKEQVNIITLHLGNGCSLCAIHQGISVDTTMGFTPLAGVMMGTRTGDFDPSILEFLHHKEGIGFSEFDTLLNKQSGLLGISGLTNDMRDLLAEESEHQDRRATLAIDMFTYSIQKHIGAFFAVLPHIDALVFTGGIGENAPAIRERICKGLGGLGVHLDKEINKSAVGKEAFIQASHSKLKLAVIPTNEELLIARDTFRALL
jgi:acetate kinase